MQTFRIQRTGEEVPVGKIVCLGRNYAEHAREMHADPSARPVVFLKPPTAILRPGEPIVRPRYSREMHHEVELVIAIGRGGKDIPASEARSHILGFGVGLDMTLRDVQSEAKRLGHPWAAAKGFDTSAPLSDIVPLAGISRPGALEIRCSVNGSVRQRTSVAEMILPVESIIEYVSTFFTLEAGDLVFTGTPPGVSAVEAGDTIEAELVGYTSTSHAVRAA